MRKKLTFSILLTFAILLFSTIVLISCSNSKKSDQNKKQENNTTIINDKNNNTNTDENNNPPTSEDNEDNEEDNTAEKKKLSLTFDFGDREFINKNKVIINSDDNGKFEINKILVGIMQYEFSYNNSEFLGWKKDKNDKYFVDFRDENLQLDENQTFYAIWKDKKDTSVKKHTVNIKYEGFKDVFGQNEVTLMIEDGANIDIKNLYLLDITNEKNHVLNIFNTTFRKVENDEIINLHSYVVKEDLNLKVDLALFGDRTVASFEGTNYGPFRFKGNSDYLFYKLPNLLKKGKIAVSLTEKKSNKTFNLWQTFKKDGEVNEDINTDIASNEVLIPNFEKGIKITVNNSGERYGREKSEFRVLNNYDYAVLISQVYHKEIVEEYNYFNDFKIVGDTISFDLFNIIDLKSDIELEKINDSVKVTYYENDGDIIYFRIEKGSVIDTNKLPYFMKNVTNGKYKLKGWRLKTSSEDQLFDFSQKINNDIVLVPVWE